MKATKRKLAIGKDRMYTLRGEQGSIAHNLDERMKKVAELLYTRLYASDVRSGETTQSTSSTCDLPLVTKEEFGWVLKGIKTGKAAGDDGITVDLLKEGGDIAPEKLAALFLECLKAQKVPIAWKNANVILIYEKGDTKDLKHYRPISLL